MRTDRRQFVQFVFGFVGVAGSAALINSCGGNSDKSKVDTSVPCNDMTGLQESDLKLRENYKYVHTSTQEGKNCANCNFYKAPEHGAECGGCQLFAGTVNANGWCTTWIKKA